VGGEGFLKGKISFQKNKSKYLKSRDFVEKPSVEESKACLPSVFGKWLTAMCGKSNKNGEQRFSLLFKTRMFV
jgi:acid phosphatase class B